MFLLYLKKRAITASFGAFIMVAALAMDPLRQQIVSFETRYVPQNNEPFGTIPVAYAYSPGDAYGKPQYMVVGFCLITC